MRILAVDDDPSILEVLSVALTSLGIQEVVTAMSAAEGLEILLDDPDVFDALLIDVQMPEMNGIEMCAQVRHLPKYAKIPLIIVTAMSQRTYISEAFRAGATDYVTKPFDLIDLRTRVTSALRQQARAEAYRPGRKMALGDAMQIRNITRLLGHDEYENYVMQIAQSLTSKSSVVAIKIIDAAELHRTLSAEQFEAAIETVAKALSTLTRHDGHVISYRGNGVFLCIGIGRSDSLPDAFEGILNKQIFANRPDALRDYTLRVCLGQTLMLKSTSKAGALDTLKAAVAGVDAKAERLAATPDMSKRVLANQSRSVEEGRVEQRVYSMLLKDVLRDEFDRPSEQRQFR